jgi:serine/threonine-protein kinase
MGECYEAVHVGLNKRVVVKLLHQAIASDPNVRDRCADRLRVEAQTLASIDSPHLVSVSDIGCTPGNRPYFVMELLRGATLREVLDRRGAIPPAEAIAWTVQVLAGLAVAHRMGIVHRDVKLTNVFLCDATPERQPLVKVLDFGVAKVLRSAGLPFPGPKYATEENSLVGSPRYVSPEQVSFGPVDARTDVYAAGVLLYTLLVGVGPFPDAQTVLDLLNAHLLEIPRPPSAAASQLIPPALDRTVLRALAKQPDARFPTADAFADELRRVADALDDQTQPLPNRRAPLSAYGAPSVVGEEPPTPIAGLLSPDAAPPGPAPSPEETRTMRGTWIMGAPADVAPLTVLPANLVAPAPPNGAAPASDPQPLSAQPDRRTFVVVALATALLTSALLGAVLRFLGAL